MEKETLGKGPKGWRKRKAKRGRVSLTQYLEFQENQDMTRLLNFTRTQARRREGVLCALEIGGLYSNGGGNINGMSFNEG